MLKTIDLKQPITVASIILMLGLFALIGPLSYENILFWVGLAVINYFNSLQSYRLKLLLKVILLALSLYVQFLFDFRVVTKEYFVHVLGVLMIFKFFELEKERDYFFFINLSFFMSIISLLDGQDIVSSFLSFSIMFFGIYLLYIVNQIEFPDFRFKNLLKILGFVLALVPFIVATYIIFPRANINLNLLKSTQNKIGIPDSITLGSFDSISNSREKVFDANFQNQNVNQKELYFRVKVFDILKENNEWVQSPSNFLNRYNFNIRKQKTKYNYQITLKGHGKKWIPVLDYPKLKNKNLITNPYKFTTSSNLKVQTSKVFNFTSSEKSYQKNIEEQVRRFFIKLPKNQFPKLKTWVDKNYQGNNEEFIKKVLTKFQSDNYYYTLTPKKIGNNYEEFFFNTKEGYCEHYAGTFAILTRLAGIPSRIVTGYYGGEYNEIGNFYTFRQSDAHSWVEVFLKNKGWVRVDPTNIIPFERVALNNNLFIEEQLFNVRNINNEITAGTRFEYELRNLFKYFTYIDYRWTQFFLSYDKLEQKKVINKIKELNKLTIDKFLLSISLIFLILIMIFLGFNKKFKTMSFVIDEFKNILLKKNIKFDKHFTHEEYYLAVHKITNDNKALSRLFKLYKKDRFQNHNLSLIEKIKIFVELKKIALTN